MWRDTWYSEARANYCVPGAPFVVEVLLNMHKLTTPCRACFCEPPGSRDPRFEEEPCREMVSVQALVSCTFHVLLCDTISFSYLHGRVSKTAFRQRFYLRCNTLLLRFPSLFALSRFYPSFNPNKYLTSVCRKEKVWICWRIEKGMHNLCKLRYITVKCRIFTIVYMIIDHMNLPLNFMKLIQDF